jgi:hypothetical protein
MNSRSLTAGAVAAALTALALVATPTRGSVADADPRRLHPGRSPEGRRQRLQTVCTIG